MMKLLLIIVEGRRIVSRFLFAGGGFGPARAPFVCRIETRPFDN